MSDPPLEKCPKCNEKVEKQMSVPGGFVFKGSGFYVTDYKGSKGNPAGEKSGFSKESPHPNKSEGEFKDIPGGKSGTNYHDNKSDGNAPTGPDYQMPEGVKV
jgi:hypothetical protein